jgi:hypothetical protein
MKNSILLIIILLGTSILGFSQNATGEKEVEEVIKRLFKGMELGDSAMVHSTFASSVTMATVYKDKTGAPQIRREDSIKGFLEAVGKPHTEILYEEIWDVEVKIDGDFAQAWCDYAFYVDKNFSHCGIDAFHFFKEKDGWKIFHLADTRRKTDCNIPENIQAKHK